MYNQTDNYYIRVEMKNPKEWKWTYLCSPINISVSNVPEIPILTPSHLQPVMEKTTVSLSCSAEAPCPKQPPAISWSNIPESANITTWLQEKPNITQSVFSHVTFKASHIDHRKNISCTATYPRNTSNDSTVETTVMLQVLFSPKETHITIDPSDLVSVGTNVTLTCKSKASPNQMNYTWYKRGQEKELFFGEKLTFNVSRRSGGCYFCTAKNIHGNQTSEEIQLIVADVPEPPILTPTDLQEVMEESTVNLSCSAEAPCSEQPPTISWSNIPESANITTQLQEKPDKTQSVFSHVIFKASYMDHRKNISCTATYPRNISNDSSVETTMTLRVLFSPKDTHITIDPSNSVSVGTNVTLTCKSKASPNEMNYIWYKRGQEKMMDFGKQLTFNVNSGSGGWYCCTATNIHGNQTSEEIHLIVAESLIIREPLIIGFVIGISAFLLIILLVIRFLRLQKIKASIISETDISDQGQEKQVNSIYVNSAFLMDEELEMPKDDNDIIHYGQIDFSTAQIKNTTEKISGQETIYAEVCASGKD
ncbi:B-cell receptor CD22-like [Labeo rohita]|uniref:B-cell receptor CD22-like n=1 Tax=Labeo rohita TaxID=84645 RepID=UPI0021E30194|nr:B-cell receptor CD22-like [Labeo rohita]XP_050958941.1 B-cell receptor CD22-like [Labeo rohita]XP_050958942.1 B-cell receptor CD22-like [Labeo rohita]